MPKLHILSGQLEGKVFDLLEERVSVGRALDNTIRMEDGTVSHHHAIFVLDGDSYKLRDLNSTNGTRVNTMRITETKLTNGDQVRMGSVEMRFESDLKKTSQPLPPSQAGVDIAELGKGDGPPVAFGSASPFGRRKRADSKGWVWGVLGLGLLAALVLVWFAYSYFQMK
ncbi:MAG TPA: FHA domain-containing protein [Verrucomicrobiae bacterium]|nr:FHA domain-containing protein [Verrucomicrobiae bacterium]